MTSLTSNAKLTIFTLASGRSGTSYLADFFSKNVQQCYSTHEPYLTAGNPTLFGKPIDWNTRQYDLALLPILERKCNFIARRKQAIYFEANHAFLKAFNRQASNMLHNPGFVHLVRHPFKVAKSELVREQMIRKLHLPFADYLSDRDEQYFRWALTGKETIFHHYADISLSRLQFYLLQWIEIEHRAMQLIKQNKWHNRVFFIDVNEQLADPTVLKKMVKFFDLPHKANFNMKLRRNKTPFIGATLITAKEEHALQLILQKLPAAYKAMLNGKPYNICSGWESLRRFLC